MIQGFDKYKIITDHLGSPVVVVNSLTGVVAQEVKYDEFGNILSDTNPGFTPFGFAGCLYDQDTKLCRFGARDYDSSIGRWLSKDPILFAGGDTNLYGYVMQDPINLIDIDGFSAQDVQNAINYTSQTTGLPNSSFSFGTPNGSSGMALPFANHILVDSRYAGQLTSGQRMNLLQTVHHELTHVKQGTLKTIFSSESEHNRVRQNSYDFMLKNWRNVENMQNNSCGR